MTFTQSCQFVPAAWRKLSNFILSLQLQNFKGTLHSFHYLGGDKYFQHSFLKSEFFLICFVYIRIPSLIENTIFLPHFSTVILRAILRQQGMGTEQYLPFLLRYFHNFVLFPIFNFPQFHIFIVLYFHMFIFSQFVNWKI